VGSSSSLSGLHPVRSSFFSAFDLIDAGDAALLGWRERMLDLFDGLARREPARASQR